MATMLITLDPKAQMRAEAASEADALDWEYEHEYYSCSDCPLGPNGSAACLDNEECPTVAS
jgi:hypothetical protein